MAKKILTKTDLEKHAIVLNDELSRLFHQRGVFPSLGGNNLYVNAVKMLLRNSGEGLLVSYYGAVRNGDRPIEERMWSSAFADHASVGDELTVEFKNGRFVAEIRPAP